MKITELQTPLKKLQQRKELLIILLFLFVITLFWIALGIFSSQQQSGVTGDEKKYALPLTPVLDATVIEKLEQKRMYDASELSEFSVITTLSPEVSSVVEQTPTTAGPQIILPEELEGELESLEQSF